jgi:D-aminopeptidase
MTRPRLREAGIRVGELPTGPQNAITDVAGVRHALPVEEVVRLVRRYRPAIAPPGVTNPQGGCK